jgi:membrane protein
VPLFTVALAVFNAFPMFARLQAGLQSWLVQSGAQRHRQW